MTGCVSVNCAVKIVCAGVCKGGKYVIQNVIVDYMMEGMNTM